MPTLSPNAPTNSAPATEACDILVVGGGPAGSTAAALLAERGIDVVMLEKLSHPRFHIGESLLPRNLAVLDRLGLRDRVHAIGVFKPGAEFVDDTTGASIAFPFTQALNSEFTHSYQVPRAEFDALLFDHARDKGVRTAERTRVTEIVLPEPGGRAHVTAIDSDGRTRTLSPRFVLDATGRDTLLAGKLRLKQSNRRNTTAALFGHFRNVERRTGEREGFITVHLVDDGWFWMIPLPGGVMSVGFVGNQSAFKGRKTSSRELFQERLAASPSVSARMQGAALVSEITATGNYSYCARSCWGEGYMMIGDAFAFLDPVFSSGVLLAMTAGELGADVAATWLRDPVAARALARRTERQIRRGMDRLSWLIYRVNTPVLRAMFMSPQNRLNMRDGLVSLLAGNLEADPRMRMPVLAFKSIYYALSLAHRLGFRPLPPAMKLATAE